MVITVSRAANLNGFRVTHYSNEGGLRVFDFTVCCLLACCVLTHMRKWMALHCLHNKFNCMYVHIMVIISEKKGVDAM
jgi:hypothetical protein